MKPYLIVLVFLSLLACDNNNKSSLTNNVNYNTISFEKSDFGLIFTNISVNGTVVKAMIDFGVTLMFYNFRLVLLIKKI